MKDLSLLRKLKKLSKTIDKDSEVIETPERNFRIFVSKSCFSIPIKKEIRKLKKFEKEKVIYPDVRISNIYLILEIERLRITK